MKKVKCPHCGKEFEVETTPRLKLKLDPEKVLRSFEDDGLIEE